jgi:predicted metal-dependent HD superfamily phosphohydrolase
MKPSNLEHVKFSIQENFSSLVSELGANNTTIQKWRDDLTARYTEPQRHYHTIEHIYSMLLCFDGDAPLIQDKIAMKLAIFFHDWIYDPEDKDNEIQSIECFKAFASEAGLPRELISKVSKYIERTITHTLPSDDREVDGDLKLFLDFDLEVLSRGSADYELYAAQIRKEYSHFSEADYCKGRVKVLEAFLCRDRLYFSDPYFRQKETRTRENIEGEIKLLEAKALGG